MMSRQTHTPPILRANIYIRHVWSYISIPIGTLQFLIKTFVFNYEEKETAIDAILECSLVSRLPDYQKENAFFYKFVVRILVFTK